MPHAVEAAHEAPSCRRHQSPNPKSSSRGNQQLSTSLSHYQHLYQQSALSQTIQRQLHSSLKTSSAPIKTILSLGLGSLQPAKGQTRRLKQLALLLALRDAIANMSGRSAAMYAQDPTFTRADESFLTCLGIRILRTPSGSSLGEASAIISPSTLVYSPFLTIDVYEELLVRSGLPVPMLLGDDFNALLAKWPKHSAERRQVEGVVKTGLGRYRRRAVGGEGFWEVGDGAFPMAVYEGRVRAKM